MAVIVDYHLHLRDEEERVSHTVDAAERFAARAVERGVDEIGFTEHVYYFEQTRELWSLPYQTERCNLLCSVHWLDGVHGVDGGPDEGAWAEWTQEEVWRRYVDALAAAASGPFDVLSHPDLVKIYGVHGSDERYEQLAAAADEADVALEISTAGLRKPVGELYPDPRLLRLSDAAITLASDAHRPGLVGEDFDRALELARSCGRETVSVFDGRARRQERLG